MTLAVTYPSKKALHESVGKPLRYLETSMFGPEYKTDGWLTVAARPHLSAVVKSEFFAQVLMHNGRIQQVK